MWGLPAPLPANHVHYGIVLILAFDSNEDIAHALFVCDDGQIRYDGVEFLKSEWRFNWTTHKWEDQTTGDLYDNEPSGDWSPEISGDIPEHLGADRSDQGDEGDGETGSVDS